MSRTRTVVLLAKVAAAGTKQKPQPPKPTERGLPAAASHAFPVLEGQMAGGYSGPGTFWSGTYVILKEKNPEKNISPCPAIL